MVDVGQVVYTHSSGESIDLFGKGQLFWNFPGKSVERQPNKVGISVDPNKVFRTVSVSAKLVTAEMVALQGYLMPASAPAYGGTYPNVAVKIDGSTTWTILCMVTKAQANHKVDDKWIVALTFEERTA